MSVAGRNHHSSVGTRTTAKDVNLAHYHQLARNVAVAKELVYDRVLGEPIRLYPKRMIWYANLHNDHIHFSACRKQHLLYLDS